MGGKGTVITRAIQVLALCLIAICPYSGCRSDREKSPPPVISTHPSNARGADSTSNRPAVQSQDSISSIGQAIDILHAAVNGYPVSASQYDIDTVRVVLGRDTFIECTDRSLSMLIQGGYIYAVTSFRSSGDGWVEEFKARLSDLDEWSIRVEIPDQYYVLNQEPRIWYVHVETADSEKKIDFNLSGMVGSDDGPRVSYLRFAVENHRDLVNSVEALKYLIRQARYGTPQRFYKS